MSKTMAKVTPSIVTTKIEKDPKRVGAGKKLPAISKQANEEREGGNSSSRGVHLTHVRWTYANSNYSWSGCCAGNFMVH